MPLSSFSQKPRARNDQPERFERRLAPACADSLQAHTNIHAHIYWLIIAYITCNSNLVPLLEGLCSSNPCRFEFSIFWAFAGIERRLRDRQSRALTNWVSFTSSRIDTCAHTHTNTHTHAHKYARKHAHKHTLANTHTHTHAHAHAHFEAAIALLGGTAADWVVDK